LDPTVLPDLRYYLGVSYYFIGDLTNSCRVLEDNVEKCDKSYAVFSEPGLNSLNDLCAIYGELDRMDDVLRCRGMIVNGWRTVTSSNNYELAMALNSLGVDQSALGKSEEAIKSYTESLELMNNCDSVLELDIPTVYSNRALSYFDLNDYNKSQEDYQMAKSKVIQIYPDTYDQYIRSYRDIAAEMTAIGDYQKAVHSLEIEITTVRSL
jgi:tetratricopeptide (TPR) repeat protein